MSAPLLELRRRKKLLLLHHFVWQAPRIVDLVKSKHNVRIVIFAKKINLTINRKYGTT